MHELYIYIHQMSTIMHKYTNMNGNIHNLCIVAGGRRSFFCALCPQKMAFFRCRRHPKMYIYGNIHLCFLFFGQKRSFSSGKQFRAQYRIASPGSPAVKLSFFLQITNTRRDRLPRRSDGKIDLNGRFFRKRAVFGSGASGMPRPTMVP